MTHLVVNVTDSITLLELFLILGSSLLVGGLLGLFYVLSKKDDGYDKSFLSTIVIISLTVSIVVALVSNDIVRAFSLGGIFLIVRFRTRIKTTKDAALLFTVIGLAYGIGLQYYLYVLICGLFVLLVLSIMRIAKIDKPKHEYYRLRILVEESLDYVGVFDSIFGQYLSLYSLKRVKLSDFGTLIELTYLIKFKDESTQKQFIDAIRRKNGNLNIVLAEDYSKIVDTEE